MALGVLENTCPKALEDIEATMGRLVEAMANIVNDESLLGDDYLDEEEPTDPPASP